jgi:hypothetical protein
MMMMMVGIVIVIIIIILITMMKYRLYVRIAAKTMKMMPSPKLWSSIGNSRDTRKLSMKTTTAINTVLPLMCNGNISYTINHEIGLEPLHFSMLLWIDECNS